MVVPVPGLWGDLSFVPPCGVAWLVPNSEAAGQVCMCMCVCVCACCRIHQELPLKSDLKTSISYTLTSGHKLHNKHKRLFSEFLVVGQQRYTLNTKRQDNTTLKENHLQERQAKHRCFTLYKAGYCAA